jgi:uncharacterized membrane protein
MTDMSLYIASVTLHVLAALLCLGGMFFLAAVGAPVLRKVEPPELRSDLFRQLGVQFRRVGWIAIAVLLATGVLNLHFRNMVSWAVLGSAGFWSSPFGRAFAWKLGCVVVMLVVQGIHDFVLGPAAALERAGTPRAVSLRRSAAWLARVNALVGIILVVAAVRLARGG